MDTAAVRYNAEDESGLNASVNNTSASPLSVTTVEVYTGVLVLVLLLTAAVIGAGLNAALLAAGIRWGGGGGKNRNREGGGGGGGMKRCGGGGLHYGLHYALAATHLVLCCVWLPLHTVQTLTNMQGDGNPRPLCLTSLALWNVCVALVTFLTLFLAVQRLYRLSSLPARTPVSRGLAVSIVVAAVATTALCIEYPWNADQRLCETGRAVHGGPLWFSVAAMLFMLIYVLVLLLGMLLLGLATLAVRRKLAPVISNVAAASSSQQDDDPRSSDTDHTRSSGGGCGSGGGAGAMGEQPSASSSHHDSAVSDSRSSGQNAVATTTTTTPAAVKQPARPDPDDDDDDDMFDMKMRMRAQKTSSGRRHTVANIGLGDSLFGFGRRRGSLEDSRPKVNYNYVRKWSVDITALQDQLENPKMQNRLPFGDLTALKDKNLNASLKMAADPSESIAEHDEEDEDATEPKKPDHVAFAEETETDNDDVQPEPAESDPLATCTEPPPAIVVLNGSSPRNHSNRVVDFATTDDNTSHNDTSAAAAAAADTTDEEAATIARYRREMWRSRQCIVLQAATLLLLLPYTFLTFLQPVMDPHLNRNLAAVSMAAVAVLSCLHPPLLVWMDARLATACRRLHAHLTQWRCVCYCNIGKGKKCFGRPADLDDGPGQVTVIA